MNIKNNYLNYTTEDFVQDDDFRKWILSPDETTAIFWTNFINNFPEKREAVELGRQIVEVLVFEETAYRKEDDKDSLHSLKEYLSRKTKQRKLALWLKRAAAVLLLPLLMAGTYLYIHRLSDETPPIVQHIVPLGEKSNVILSDGTRVWLNSGSTLSYESNGKQVRKVHLTGEAFFDVTKNNKIPFLVETKNYVITVHGTQFNVNAYEDKAFSEIILKEGLIAILFGKTEEVILKPGQRFFLNKEKKYSLSDVNPDLYLNWKENTLRISNEELGDLIIRMERWYGITIQVEDFDKVKHLRYTLTIKTESLREMLELMKYVTPLSYEINGENVVLKYH